MSSLICIMKSQHTYQGGFFMIFDWKNNKEEAIRNGISEKQNLGSARIIMNADAGVVSGHTFLNFPTLEFEKGSLIKDCIFENCKNITFDDFRVDSCKFKNAGFIFCRESKFTNSTFSDLFCDDDTLICLDYSDISYCNFNNIRLTDDSILIDGASNSLIEHCTFSDIKTERSDGEIILCEETEGLLFKRKVKYSIVDEDSCTGLDEIEII